MSIIWIGIMVILRWEHWDTERLNNSPKVTQLLVKVRTSSQPELCLTLGPCASMNLLSEEEDLLWAQASIPEAKRSDCPPHIYMPFYPAILGPLLYQVLEGPSHHLPVLFNSWWSNIPARLFAYNVILLIENVGSSPSKDVEVVFPSKQVSLIMVSK